MKFEYRILTDFEKVFCSEKLTPEIPLADGISPAFTAARGEIIAFQAAFYCTDSILLSIRTESELNDILSIREVRHVPCDMPTQVDDDYILRSEPGIYPDPLCDLNGPLALARNRWQAVWITLRVPEDFKPGSYDINLFFNYYEHPGTPWKRDFVINEKATVKINIHPAVLPKQKLICTNWFYADCLSEFYHEEPWTERFWQILENYFRDFTAHGRNMLLTPLWSVPLDTAIGHERPTCQLLDIEFDGKNYKFDFGKLKRWIDLGKKCGVEYFEMSHFFTQWGAKAAPKIMVRENGELIRKFGWDTAADSAEYSQFLTELLPPLLDFLRKEGLAGKCYFHVSDEPAEKMIEDYKRSAEPIHKNLNDDEFPVIDALSSVKYFHEGLIKRPVPWTLHLEDFQKENIEHRWCYFAHAPNCSPVRSYGAPICRYRVLGILLYLYEIEGFLHWGHNFWFSQYCLRTNLNPWTETTADHAFTGGHSFNVYPLPDGKPADALHYEVFMSAMQDMRLLQLLESKIGREKTVALICEGLSYQPTMTHYPHEAIWQYDLRRRIFAVFSNGELSL